MDWSNYLYHDHTPFYTDKEEANIGDTLRLRIRVPKNAPLRAIELVTLYAGDLKRQMCSLESEDANWLYYAVEIELTQRRTIYFFWVHTSEQSFKYTARGIVRSIPRFRDWFVFLAEHHKPNWLSGSVFYQIFPDRFFNGDPSNDPKSGEYTYMGKPIEQMPWEALPEQSKGPLQHWGGDLEGIRQKLPYLEDLGVNGIYLNPIFKSPSNHRYDTENYLEVDPHLGGQAAFDALLAECKQRGIRVVLDGVFNHTGDRASEFKKALEGKIERQMFTFRPDGTYEAFFGVKTLPKLDFESHQTFDHLLEGDHAPVRHWIRAGVDGWRLDVAHMMGKGGTERGNLEILRRLKAAARLENKEAWVFGERFLDAEGALYGASEIHEHDGGGEDGVMNYQGFGLPIVEWLGGIDHYNFAVRLETEELVQSLEESYRVLPVPMRFSHYNLFGSHDTARALTRMGGDVEKLKTAFALLLTYPGVPGIYYGDEIGLSGENDPHCRAPFVWTESAWNLKLRKVVQKLIAVRKQNKALQSGALRFLEHRDDALTYARTYTHEDGRTEIALIGANRGTAQTMLFNTAILGVFEGSWRDVLTDEVFHARDGVLKATVFKPRVLVQV
ncbi:MAG: alpha-amylase family glycosyl hydrolase [Deinococcales bacterium]